MLSIYPACFFEEATGGYSVFFPDLDNLATCGDTFDDAMEMAIDCLAGYITWLKADGDAIPQPSKLSDVDANAILADVFSDLEPPLSTTVSMVAVDVEAYAKQHFDKAVRKNVTIPKWLNDTAIERGINFSQTLQEALMQKIQQKA